VGPDDRFRPPAASRAVAAETFACGAVVTGRRTFDVAGGWGGRHPSGAPFFVVTHRPVADHVGPGTGGTAVGDLPSALARARAVAAGRDVVVGAADLVQQCLAAEVLDEIVLHQVPVVLGGGVPLFAHLTGPIAMTCTQVVASDGVTHLRYRVDHHRSH
jgi:dihydrofolate reductase